MYVCMYVCIFIEREKERTIKFSNLLSLIINNTFIYVLSEIGRNSKTLQRLYRAYITLRITVFP